MVSNKRGFATLMLVFFIFVAFFLLIIMGSFFYGFELFHEVAGGINVTIGNVSFSEEYGSSLGNGFEGALNMIVTSSITVLFGMIAVMLLVAYKFRSDRYILIPLDVFIIIAAFITAVYVSGYFESFINANEIFLDIYSIDLSKASTFVLNLPIIVAVTGALIMLATYLPLRKKEPNVLQFNN